MKLFNRKNKTAEEKKENRKGYLYGLITGILMGASFPPSPFPYFMFAALIPYFFILEKQEKLGRTNKFTYFTFFIFNLIALYWVGSWTKEADPFLMISGVILMFFNPLLFLIPSTLFHFARKALGSNKAFFLFPFFWVFYEFIYTLTDLRFPWLTLANGMAKFNLFIQPADIIGAYGISLLILFINVTFFFAVKEIFAKKKYFNAKLIIPLLLLIIPLLYGIIREASFQKDLKTIKVGLVQPNLDPWNKWDEGGFYKQLDIYLGLSDKAVKNGASLIVWPESALPGYLLTAGYDNAVERIRSFTDENKASLLTGMPDARFYFDKSAAPEGAKKVKNSETLYTTYNSILLFQPNNPVVQRYGKIMLVPFGERVPFLDAFPFLGEWIKWNVGITSWNVGKEKTIFTLNDSTKIAGVICIESIYPDFVSSFVKKGAQLIVVVTNDSWYGYSSGPYQHKEISVLRAVENRRTLLRAANGGITCVIDPLGRTVSSTNLFTRDVLVSGAKLNDEMTFYTRFPFVIPAFVCTISCCMMIFYFINKLFNKKKMTEKL